MAHKPSPAPDDAGDHTVFGPDGASRQARPAGAVPSGRPVARQRDLLPSMLGPYEVVEVVGRGGMGLVLKCRDNALKREVAIKVLPPDARADPVARARFVKEAQITGQLEHPGIVSVHLLGQDEGEHEFFSMKLVSGRPLNKILEQWHAADRPTRAEFPRARLVSIFERICETIGFAHSRGIIHRDLKPSNIMIGRHGEVWVLDWGLAKLLHEADDASGRKPESGALPAELNSDMTMDGMIVGTPEYMAPEQASAQPLDEGVDIFGLGALLYEMLTGQPPHSGGSVREVVTRAARAHVAPVALTRRGRDTPRPLAAIAHKCLAQRREDRYATVDDLLADVRAYAAGERISALPDTVLDRAQRFIRRHGRAVAAGIIVATALLVTVSVSAVRIAHKDRQAREAEAAQQQEREARLQADLGKQKTLAAAADAARKRLAAFEPYSQAMDLLMRGQLPDRATSLLRRSLDIDSSFPEAQFALGEALRAWGKPLDAAAAYLKADELSRQIAGRPNLTAVVAAGFALDGAGSYADGEDAFARAEREGANDPLSLVGRACRLGHHRKLLEARKAAEEAQSLAPQFWETHFAVGYVLAECVEEGLIPPDEGRKSAIAALRKALELSPRQADVWVWLSIALSRSGTPEARAEAVACAQRAIALEPLNGCRYANRAGYRLSGGDIAGAEQDLAEARRLGVAPSTAQVYEARLAGARGNEAEAYRLMGEVVQKTREWPSHVANWIVLGINLGKFSEVKPALDRLAAQHPTYPYVFVLRGTLKAAEGNAAAAVAEVREGLKATPYHVALRKRLAAWTFNAGQYKEALEASDKALELAANDASVKNIRLGCLSRLGRTGDAKSYLETLKKEHPERAAEWAKAERQIKADGK